MDRLFKAEVETPNFQFEAYGRTVDAAEAALKRGWEAHLREYRGATMTWQILLHDVVVREVRVGSAYRDGEELEG